MQGHYAPPARAAVARRIGGIPPSANTHTVLKPQRPAAHPILRGPGGATRPLRRARWEHQHRDGSRWQPARQRGSCCWWPGGNLLSTRYPRWWCAHTTSAAMRAEDKQRVRALLALLASSTSPESTGTVQSCTDQGRRVTCVPPRQHCFNIHLSPGVEPGFPAMVSMH
eukprot:254943-Chlamydomonas_euryale.AAC.5